MHTFTCNRVLGGNQAVQTLLRLMFLDEIIQKVNGLFDGELSDDDQLVWSA